MSSGLMGPTAKNVPQGTIDILSPTSVFPVAVLVCPQQEITLLTAAQLREMALLCVTVVLGMREMTVVYVQLGSLVTHCWQAVDVGSVGVLILDHKCLFVSG